MSYEQIAAVDMGSNSFHLQVGRVVEDQIYPLDTLKEPVRLASGLTPEKQLDEFAQARALETLGRFAERLRGFHPDAVRAVATNTLRVAKNARAFIAKAEAVLGFPIEVISGMEEARLIYIGAAHAMPPDRHKRLVVDIGGGSTELIIGEEIQPLLMKSAYMGCVSFSLRFFPSGKIDKERFQKAEIAARRELQNISRDFRQVGWSEAVATSKTARAIADLLEINGLNPDGVVGITREGLSKLRSQLIRAGSAAELKLEGLRVERIPVFPGGVAIMSAIFAEFNIERMVYSEGALRLGVLYDQLGRFHHQDMRDSTVHQFMRRYQVDALQADRVKRTALGLLGQMIQLDAPEHEAEVNFLHWAASLHEIGISIALSGFHKHGAYIVSNADMPGFSKQDQERLAFLILGQRGKLEKLPALASRDRMWRLVFCLRLGELLKRSRDEQPLPAIAVRQLPGGFQVELPSDWLRANPLSASALADEVLSWQNVGLLLRVKRRTVPPGENPK